MKVSEIWKEGAKSAFRLAILTIVLGVFFLSISLVPVFLEMKVFDFGSLVGIGIAFTMFVFTAICFYDYYGDKQSQKIIEEEEAEEEKERQRLAANKQ